MMKSHVAHVALAIRVTLALLISTTALAQTEEFTIRGDTLIKYNGTAASVTVPDNVKVIGREAFTAEFPNANTTLTSVSLPSGITEIGDAAFWNCQTLASVNIPSGVTIINMSTFYNCFALRNITLPDGLQYILFYAFANSGLTSITIPANVSLVDAYAFMGCTGLTSVTIPNNVSCKLAQTFSDCTGLTTAIVGDGIYELNGAFDGCTNLRTLVLGRDVQLLYTRPFVSAPNLETLIMRCPQPPSITAPGTLADTLPANRTLYVPVGYDNSYRSDGNNYTSWATNIIADIPVGRPTAYGDTAYVHDTITAYDTTYVVAVHDTLHDTIYKDSAVPVLVHDTLHDTTTWRNKDTAWYFINFTLHDTLHAVRIVDTLHDTIALDNIIIIYTDSLYLHDTAYAHIDASRTDTIWHTDHATDTARVNLYDTTRIPIDDYDTLRTIITVVDPTLPPAQLLLHDTLIQINTTKVTHYFLLDPLSDDSSGTGIFVAPSRETRVSDAGAGILLEGLTAGEPFAIYSLDGLLIVRALAPENGVYVLRDLARGTYLLRHADKWGKFVHK